MTVEIIEGHAPEFVTRIRELFVEYSTWLGVDLCFQGFDEELKTLPGKYAPPGGAILLAQVEGEVAGCVAMRPLEPGICEMKRLWVREGFRRMRLGHALAGAIIEKGRSAGYERMRLDTLSTMDAALGLYRHLGFREIDAYYPNPMQAVVYLEKTLD